MYGGIVRMGFLREYSRDMWPKAGYVYILSNPCFLPNIYKVGATRKTPQERALELSKETSAPAPFKIEYSLFYRYNCFRAEKFINDVLKVKQYQVCKNKEFFEVPIEEIIFIMNYYKENLEPYYDEGQELFKLVDLYSTVYEPEVFNLLAVDLNEVANKYMKQIEAMKDC